MGEKCPGIAYSSTVCIQPTVHSATVFLWLLCSLANEIHMKTKKIIKWGGGAGGKQEEKPIGQLDTWMQPAKHEEEAFLITFN